MTDWAGCRGLITENVDSSVLENVPVGIRSSSVFFRAYVFVAMDTVCRRAGVGYYNNIESILKWQAMRLARGKRNSSNVNPFPLLTTLFENYRVNEAKSVAKQPDGLLDFKHRTLENAGQSDKRIRLERKEGKQCGGFGPFCVPAMGVVTIEMWVVSGLLIPSVSVEPYTMGDSHFEQ